VKKCLQCGSVSDTNRSKKILCAVFFVFAVLLILIVSRFCR
jgi:hypothetical protein